MLNQLARDIVHVLWDEYKRTTPQMQNIMQKLSEHSVQDYSLDHFALIDLPSQHAGIPVMKKIFSHLGFIERGSDYLAEKQNDFLWMAQQHCEAREALQVLPQVVVADFRLECMPDEIATIIRHYASFTRSFSFAWLEEELKQLHVPQAYSNVLKKITQYFSGREWPLPTISEFKKVQAFNELLAWVLVFGRRANHFTLGMHLQKHFANLEAVIETLCRELNISFNTEGGLIKGSEAAGILQASTHNVMTPIKLADGEIDLPLGFVELVWRFPLPSRQDPKLWGDFYSGFVAAQASRVIESLYHKAG